MKKTVYAICLVFATVMLLTACGGGDSKGAATPSPSASTNADGNVKEFTLNASNFEFDLKEIKVNKGDTVKIKLVNKQGNHAVKFDNYDKELKANQTVTFVADKTGEFKFICSIMCGAGHADMVGTMIVT